MSHQIIPPTDRDLLNFFEFPNNNIIRTAIIRPATVRMPQLAICEENFLPFGNWKASPNRRLSD